MRGTVLLTGSTGKLGRVMAKALLHSGWNVVAAGRDEGRLRSLLQEMVGLSGVAYPLVVDLCQPDSAVRVCRELAEKGLRITHLVNNARSIEALAVQDDGRTSREAFLREFELDVVVPYELVLAIAHAPEHGLKAVVNIGSQYGVVAPNPALYEGILSRSPVQYGVAKAGLHHLTRELAVRLAPLGVRVNCVAFGGVEGRVDESFKNRYAALVPSGRMLQEAEIPGPVEFLLSDASSAINGHVLVADGGWSIW